MCGALSGFELNITFILAEMFSLFCCKGTVCNDGLRVLCSGLFQCVGRHGEESASFAVPVMTSLMMLTMLPFLMFTLNVFLTILKVRSLSVKPFAKYLSLIMQFLSSNM